jgi:hypothetical protein
MQKLSYSGLVLPILKSNERLLRWITVAGTVVFVILSVYGGIVNYSPVTYGDGWSGLVIYTTIIGGSGWPVWWIQHNEHRILFTKALIFLDTYEFGGRLIFLIAMNYLLLAATFVVLMMFLRALSRRNERNTFLIASVAACLTFSWGQRDNLTWSFQSCYFAAQLFPLIAVYLLDKSVKGPVSYFFLSSAVGFASFATLVSGLLALPVIIIFAVLERMARWRLAWLVLLTSIMFVWYFHDYVPAPGQKPIFEVLRQHPIGVAEFILFYLGAPMFVMLGGGGCFILCLSLPPDWQL